MNPFIFPEYGPSWKRIHDLEVIRKDYLSFPVPDGVNCGPIFKTEIKDSSTSSPLSGNDIATRSTEFTVTPRKAVNEKFPFTVQPPYALPIRSPCRSLTQKVDIYSGNHCSALSSFTLNDAECLIYAETSPKAHILKTAQVQVHNEDRGDYLTFIKQRNISKLRKLYQVDSAVINNTPYALVLCDDALNHVVFTDNSSFSIHSMPQMKTMHCSLNPHLCYVFAFIEEFGNVCIYDVKRNRSVVNCQFINECDVSDRWSCQFGCHPLELNVGCENGVWNIDGRSDPRKNHFRKLFDFNTMEKYVDKSKEVVCSFKSLESLPFVYVMCSETAVLIDKRYCSQPVLSWQHLLGAPPIYPQTFEMDGLNVLLSASRQLSQVCAITSQWTGDNFPFVKAISTPKHLSVIKNAVSFARNNGLWLSDNVMRSVQSPLVGMTSFSSKEEARIYVQNQFGDLFQFRLAKEKNNQTTKDSTSLRIMQNYEKDLERPSGDAPVHKSVTVRHLEHKHRSFNVSLSNKTISQIPSCKGEVWDLSRVYSNAEDILNVGIGSPALKRIAENSSPINFFHQKHHKRLKKPFLKTFEDDLSKKILTVWKDKIDLDDDSPTEELPLERGFFFKRFPLDLGDDIVIPGMKDTLSSGSETEEEDIENNETVKGHDKPWHKNNDASKVSSMKHTSDTSHNYPADMSSVPITGEKTSIQNGVSVSLYDLDSSVTEHNLHTPGTLDMSNKESDTPGRSVRKKRKRLDGF